MYSPVRDGVRICQSSQALNVVLAYDELEEVWTLWLVFSFNIQLVENSIVVESS
jgi:hypothetical protein